MVSTEFRVTAAAINLAVMLAGAAMPGTVLAQSPQQTAEPAVEEIIVTGSRIPRRDYSSPSPITTIDSLELRISGTTNIEDSLNAMPQFVADLDRSSNNPGNGTSTANLRGLGARRSLVLLDGKRFISSTSFGTVDLNNIPTALIQRIEVVSGGASAVYGSDALAGAINFILKTDFEGIELSTQYDITAQGDGAVYDVNLAGGTRFAADRGSISGFLNYQKREPIFQGDREFTKNATFDDIFTGEIFTGGSVRTPAGQIPNPVNIGGTPAPDGITFNLDGTPRPFIVPDDEFNFAPFNYLQTPLVRSTAGVFSKFDLNNDTRFYGEILYVDNDATQELAPTLNAQFVQMNIDNPFVTPATRQVLEDFFDPDADGIAEFIFNKRFPELGSRIISSQGELTRIVVGFETQIMTDWTFDIHYVDAKSDTLELKFNDGSRSRFQQSLFVDPVTRECIDPTGGCVPSNIFGEGNISAEAADYFRAAPLKTSIGITQSFIAASVVGDLISLPAGDLGFAFGVEIRDDGYSEVPDDANLNSDLLGYFVDVPIDGEVELREVFGELAVPILSDRPFAQYLGIEAGYRYTDHSLAGTYDSWKLSAEWELFTGYRLRASAQQAVRAPNAREYFRGKRTFINAFVAEFGDLCSASVDPVQLGIADVCIAQGIPASQIGVYEATPFFPTVTTTGGNLGLDPEVGDTLTVGIVIQPGFLPNLSLSLDYYSIEIDNAIQEVDPFDTLLLCFEIKDPSDPLCQAVERDPVNFNVSALTGGPRNVAKIRTEGYDLQITFDHDLPGWLAMFDRSASLRWRFLGNNTIENGTQITPDASFINCAGNFGFPCNVNSFGSIPAYKTTTRLTYDSGPLSLSLRWRWIDGMRNAFLDHGLALFGIPEDAVTFAIPDIPSQSYFALSFDFEFNDMISVYGGIKNLLDSDPPLLGSNQVQSNTDPSIYDVYGRRYFIGLTARFWN